MVDLPAPGASSNQMLHGLGVIPLVQLLKSSEIPIPEELKDIER
jgi:hypothetical protein